jgi:hypothetical protein
LCSLDEKGKGNLILDRARAAEGFSFAVSRFFVCSFANMSFTLWEATVSERVFKVCELVTFNLSYLSARE